MAGNPEVRPPRTIAGPVAVVVSLGLLFFIYPLFRIVPIKAPGDRSVGPSGVGAFDPAVAAARIWQTDLPAAAVRAVELELLAPALQADPKAAREKFARSTGLGTAYFLSGAAAGSSPAIATRCAWNWRGHRGRCGAADRAGLRQHRARRQRAA